MGESEMPVMVNKSSISKPQFSCILADKGQTLLEICQEVLVVKCFH
jgi:hypothetical protein